MNDKNRHLSEEKILEITRSCVGQTFGSLGLSELNERNKGGLGGFVEEHVFNYKANNDANPDFIDAGIELKVTPVKLNKNKTISAKERLVLNKINYIEEADKDFETSSFYKKNRKLLIWFYLHMKDKNPKDFEITNFELFEFEKTSFYQKIRSDWEIIHEKIVSGEAHLISESDTTFLAACTKGVDGKGLVEQYNSDKKAKPRAYSFKSNLMTTLYRQIIHEISPYSPFVSEDEWMKNPIEEVYKEKVQPYVGKSIKELKIMFNIKYNGKAIGRKVAEEILGFNGKDNNLELYESGIKLKTVRLNYKGYPAESMSFPAFDFSELVNQKWEESDIREEFVDWKILFFVFQNDKNSKKVENARFKEILFWNVPNKIVDGPIKKMYESAAKLIKEGNALYIEKGRIKDNFPKETRNSNGVCHIRPHGINKKDTLKLPVKDKITGLTNYTKQCFWFNREFIENLIEKLEEDEFQFKNEFKNNDFS